MANSFDLAMKEEAKKTITENGAEVLNTTSNTFVDVFSMIGALRSRSVDSIEAKIQLAFDYDKLLATKLLFYTRDILGGLGERNTFRVAINYVARRYPEIVKKNMANIAQFGRFDDYYSLIGTPVEDDMWTYLNEVIRKDMDNLAQSDKGVSLAGKWLYSSNTTNKKHSKLGVLTAKKLGLSLTEYRHLLRDLRKRIDVTEQKMCSQNWGDINYEAVPSLAMLRYGKAFYKHDYSRFSTFINRVSEGTAKVNASTITPKDVLMKLGLRSGRKNFFVPDVNSKEVQLQWEAMPDFLAGNTHSAIGVVDTSDSMCYNGIIESALGLGIYLAERNKGAFHDKMITFSSHPSYIDFSGAETVADKIKRIPSIVDNTNLEAVFDLILDTAVEHNVPQEDMPATIIVFSDMQIDNCVSTKQLESNFTKSMRAKFQERGYDLPTIIFWNLDARSDATLASVKDNVQFFSGNTPAVFGQVVNAIGRTAFEAVIDTLNNSRYDCVVI